MTESDEKLIEVMAEDYDMVLQNAKSMGCNNIRALYNIPLKNMELIVQALKKHIEMKRYCDEMYDTAQLAIKALQNQIKKENADGCNGCAFEDVEEWELPCRKCKRACKDYWRAKERGTMKNEID